MTKVRARWPARRGIVAALCLAATMASAAAGRGPQPVLDGPSVLLSYVDNASPYTGVGRYEGRATCTAFLVDTGALARDAVEAPGYALTSGHCATDPEPNEVLLDRPGLGEIAFNLFNDSERWQVRVPVARVAYATVKGLDLAVLELTVSSKDLARRLIRPLRIATPVASLVGEPVDVVGAPLWPDGAASFLRASRCRIDGVAPVVLQRTWHWFDAPFNRCRDVLPSSAGSPVTSLVDQRVVGMVNATSMGASPVTACSMNQPCEPVASGLLSRAGTTYLTPLAGVGRCFNRQHRFDLEAPGCALDRGDEPAAVPDHLGPVNPLLDRQPIGPVRRTWNVTVTGTAPFYRHAIVTPPADDCRTTRRYGAPVGVDVAPTIDLPLPLAEGVVFLCIVGAEGRDGGDGEPLYQHPTVLVARTDLTPPRIPAQVDIVESGDAWRVRFSTVGQEIAFYLFKVGPPADIACDRPEGYRPIEATVIGLPKVSRPYHVCAVPYDAAQNAGGVFQRRLR